MLFVTVAISQEASTPPQYLYSAAEINAVPGSHLYDQVQVGDGKLQRFGMEPQEEYAKTLASVYHNKLAPDRRERLKSANVSRKRSDVPAKKEPLIPLLSVTVGQYLLTDSLSRQIFGSPSSFVGFGIRDFGQSPSSNDLVGVTLNTVYVGGVIDDFWVVSPQIAYEHRFPITRTLTSYAKLMGGPAYMDYTFNMPNGDHFGAKRLGAEMEAEVGLRYRRFQFSLEYHVMTEPQNVSFNGIEFSLSWIAVRF